MQHRIDAVYPIGEYNVVFKAHNSLLMLSMKRSCKTTGSPDKRPEDNEAGEYSKEMAGMQ